MTYSVKNEMESDNVEKIADFLQKKYLAGYAEWSVGHVCLFKSVSSAKAFKRFDVSWEEPPIIGLGYCRLCEKPFILHEGDERLDTMICFECFLGEDHSAQLFPENGDDNLEWFGEQMAEQVPADLREDPEFWKECRQNFVKQLKYYLAEGILFLKCPECGYTTEEN